ncbi:DUF3368 domain-containing protein [Candidatus Woesearchaeota archaeon]|nr:DUF3368 domain-containing protein [Candidatus Woesearchaeota archaeon]
MLVIPILNKTVFFMAAARKLITRPEAEKTLNALVDAGYYISPAEYALLLSKLKK